MDDIRLYDFEFNLLHIENDILSSIWDIRHNGIGTWEAHFDVDSDIIPVILNNPYLVAAQGTKQAIITGKQAVEDGVVYGRTVNWILSRRTIAAFKSVDLTSLTVKDAESIARYVASTAFADVTNFELGAVAGFTAVQTFDISSPALADGVIRNCLELEKAGHEVLFDTVNKKWVFRVTKGTVLDLIVSEANLNAYDTEYTEDMQEYYNGGWYERKLEDKGTWNASTNSPALTNNVTANYAKFYKVTVAGTQFGIAFAVGDYIVCRSTTGAWAKSDKTESVWTHIAGDQTGIYKWDAVLSGSVESEAKADLAKMAWRKEIQTKTRDLQYGVDYNLGDTVRVQKQVGQFKATFTKRIIGVKLSYENNNVGEQPVFEEV